MRLTIRLYSISQPLLCGFNTVDIDFQLRLIKHHQSSCLPLFQDTLIEQSHIIKFCSMYALLDVTHYKYIALLLLQSKTSHRLFAAKICSRVMYWFNVFIMQYLHSGADISKLEAILVEQVKSENINIHQSRATTQDVVYRLPIAHCELVVVNMFAPTIRPHPITDAPLTMVCDYVYWSMSCVHIHDTIVVPRGVTCGLLISC